MPESSETGRVRRVLRSRTATFLVVFVVFCVSPNVIPHGDPFLVVPTARSLVHDGDLDLTEYLNVPAVLSHYGLTREGDRFVDYFPWVTAATAVPVTLGVDAISAVAGTPDTDELIRTDRTWPIQLIGGSLLAAGATLLIALVSEALIDRTTRVAATTGRRPPLLALALAVGLTTPLWSTVSRGLWQHGPSLVFLAGALLVLLRVERSPTLRRIDGRLVGVGALAGAAYWARPTNAVAVAAIGLIALVMGRRPALTYAAGAAGAFTAGVLANLALVGVAVPKYYAAGRIGWHREFVEAFLANLVSPSRGLLFTLPQIVTIGAVLTHPDQRSWSRVTRRLVFVGPLVPLGYALAVSGFANHWWAGHSYGARFLIESLPFVLPIAVVGSLRLLQGRGALAAGTVVLWSLAGVVHFEGAWFHSTTCWNGSPTDIDLDPGRVWSVTDPQFASGFASLVEDGPADALWRSCENGAGG